MDWLKKYYPNVTLNRDDGPFFPQYMIRNQETKPTDDNGIGYLMQCLKKLNIKK